MNITVLLSSGTEDVWEDVEGWSLGAVGTLMITGTQGVAAAYAPGMWMKVENADGTSES